MSFATPHDGSGTVLRFGANTYTVTNVVIENTNPATDSIIDVSHLGQTTGQQALTMETPLVPAPGGDSGRQITFDYLGKTILLDGSTATVLITVAGTALVGTSGVGSTLTLATNDVIRGQGVLTLARTSSIT